MKTICIVTVGLGAGGIENYLLRFCNYKHREFKRIFIFCRGARTGILETQFLQIPNVTIVPQRIQYANPFEFLKFFFFLKKNKIDTVCDFTGNIAGPVILTAKLAGVNTRITQYRMASNRFKGNFIKNLYNGIANKMVRAFSTRILSNSYAALDYFFPKRDKSDKKYQVIYNGLDVDTFLTGSENLRKELSIPQDAFVVGNTARFNDVKNHRTILKVAGELCGECPDLYFILCGKDVRNNLVGQIDPGLESRIILLEARTDIIKVLNTLDCFYFPSLMEGQPNALIEAMAVGLPFVASNIAPILETVPGDMHDQLVDPLDWEAACEKILSIKENAEMRAYLDCSEYVKKRFDHRVQFQLFFDCL